MQIEYAGVCVTYTRMVEPALMCNITMSVYLYCSLKLCQCRVRCSVTS